MIKIYNTLTRKKEELKTIEPGKVKMYVCGPTVYDAPHVGHARSAFVFDVIRRYLEHRGFRVVFVRNVTDVDDKIIKKAAGELGSSGKKAAGDDLKNKVREVSDRYLKEYHSAMDELGVKAPDHEPKATENISGMIKFISLLIDKGHAYVTGGNVYFDVGSFSGYGKLSGQDKDQMMQGARIEKDDKKKDHLDFALWKEVKPGEPCWESPWGMGRPGWHIECSAMSTDILGPEFDIHGGGLDLIFPHHENEIAQAEAATGCSFSRYWVHNGFLTINNEKMSKSLGNFISVKDILAEHAPDVIKMFMLKTHYRSPIDFSEKSLEESRAALDRIKIFLWKADLGVQTKKDNPEFGKLQTSENNGERLKKIIDEHKQKFIEVMDDDFNTPEAIAVIFELINQGWSFIEPFKINSEDLKYVNDAIDAITEMCNTLGLSLEKQEISKEDAESIESKITERNDARKAGDFKKADEIRDELISMGIVIEDTPEGTVWRKN